MGRLDDILRQLSGGSARFEDALNDFAVESAVSQGSVDGSEQRLGFVSLEEAELYASLADNTTDRFVARLARINLLVLDDLRDMPPKEEYTSLLYEVIDARNGKNATVLSSNLNVKQWGKALGNRILTASLVDRLMERGHVINIKRGRSYRTHGPDAPPDDQRPSDLAGE